MICIGKQGNFRVSSEITRKNGLYVKTGREEMPLRENRAGAGKP
jgi:hypothetical protein